ncbi:MAG: peptidoglycan DD-metalloendopeptidase family protein, partial [Chloroflexota bacterium]|nr:peptidoglycan DD-metalloendopeptidase family protein [Chloroflexota bacterium]
QHSTLNTRVRPRWPWMVTLLAALIGMAVVTNAWAQQRQRADTLAAEITALRAGEQQVQGYQSELSRTLRLQQQKLAGQDQQIQSSAQDVTSVNRELSDLRDRLARLDAHNAELRDALGLTIGDAAPANPPATASPTTGPNGQLPAGMGGESGPLLALGGRTTPLPTPPADTDFLAQCQSQLADLRHSLDVHEQIEDALTDVATQRLREWAQLSDDDTDTNLGVDTSGSEPVAPPPATGPAPSDKGSGAKPAPGQKPSTLTISHIPQGYPFYGAISSPFGYRISPFVAGKGGYHKGIDIVAPTGTPVQATQAGRVIMAGWSDVYGRVVILNHGGGWVTLYGHNSRLLVQVGDWVEHGQVIAHSGSTGMSTGPHIHYEIRHNDVPVNPAKYR